MKVPSVGDCVYVPTVDGQAGGLAKITKVTRVAANLHHVMIEKCGAYAWEGGLAELQTELKLEFGNKKAVR